MDLNQILPQGQKLTPREYSPLVLAYIGDSVYELFIRAKLIGEGNTSVSNLHKRAIGYVKAKAQSDAVKALMDKLSEDELWVFKRGRNAKSATVPKNADMSEYHHATGFEALVGYLYVSGQNSRLYELLEITYSLLSK